MVLRSLDVTSGREEWSYVSTGRGIYEDRSPPAVLGRSLIAHDGESVFALDVESGALLWRKPGTGFTTNSANSLIIVFGIYPMAAYRADTGAEAWTTDYDAQGAVTRDSYLVTLRDQGVRAWNVATGQEVWRIDVGPEAELGGITSDQAIIGRGSALEWYGLTDGALTRSLANALVEKSVFGVISPPNLTLSPSGDFMLFHSCVTGCPSSGPATRTAYDPRTGGQLWQSPCTCGEPTGFSWLTDNVFLEWNADSSSVELVDASTGVLWTRSYGTFQPTSATGDESNVYLVDDSGAILASVR